MLIIVQVVKRESATFAYSSCENIPLQRNHKHLNKFIYKDTDYRVVLGAITTCIEQIGKFTASDQDIEGWLSSCYEKQD